MHFLQTIHILKHRFHCRPTVYPFEECTIFPEDNIDYTKDNNSLRPEFQSLVEVEKVKKLKSSNYLSRVLVLNTF